MNQGNVSRLISGFVVLIIGIILIIVVANNSAAVTGKTYIFNESIDISDARNESGAEMALNYTVDIIIDSDNIPTGWKLDDCLISGFSLINQSGTALVAATDYDFSASTGVINFYDTVKANMSGTSNTTFGFYTICENDYLNSGWARSVMHLIAGFFALTLMIAAAGIFYGIAKDEGILNK